MCGGFVATLWVFDGKHHHPLSWSCALPYLGYLGYLLIQNIEGHNSAVQDKLLILSPNHTSFATAFPQLINHSLTILIELNLKSFGFDMGENMDKGKLRWRKHSLIGAPL